ncbi:MAG: RNA methyltransferase [Chloroflexi bacterium]|nr:RNA methyltransferase [Chloroflexota bacterium]
MTDIITSSANPAIKLARALRQKKGREETGLFLVEGIHHVGEALAAGWEVEQVLYAPDLLEGDFVSRLLGEAQRDGRRCQAVTGGVFESISGKENPQGIIAILRQRQSTLDDFDRNAFRWGAALVSPQDPGNVGTVLRTLDAVGAGGLFLLDGGVEPHHPTAVRASMGAIFWIPVIRASFADFTAWARAERFRLLGSTAHSGMHHRQVAGARERTILVLGSEQKGLTVGQLAACDQVVSLPMGGRCTSLNLAVAAGILLYTLAE